MNPSQHQIFQEISLCMVLNHHLVHMERPQLKVIPLNKSRIDVLVAALKRDFHHVQVGGSRKKIQLYR